VTGLVFALAAAFSNAVNLITSTRRASAPRGARRAAAGPLPAPAAAVAAGGRGRGGLVCFQAIALHNGRCRSSSRDYELVFVLLLPGVDHQEWPAPPGLPVVVCVALAVFLAAAEPTGGHPVRRRPSGCPPGSCSARHRRSGVLGTRGAARRAAVFAWRGAYLGAGGDVPQTVTGTPPPPVSACAHDWPSTRSSPHVAGTLLQQAPCTSGR